MKTTHCIQAEGNLQQKHGEYIKNSIKVVSESSRLLQSWPRNPRKQRHLPSTQSPLKLHELGHWPDIDTGSVLQSSWYAGQTNSPVKIWWRVEWLCQLIGKLTSTYKQLTINKIELEVLLTIKTREQNRSTSMRTHFPNTIHSNLQENYEVLLVFVIKEIEGRVEHPFTIQ